MDSYRIPLHTLHIYIRKYCSLTPLPAVLQRPDGKLAAIEVKARDAVTASDFKTLKELQRQTEGDFICWIVLYRGKKVIPFNDNMWAVPVDAMWS